MDKKEKFRSAARTVYESIENDKMEREEEIYHAGIKHGEETQKRRDIHSAVLSYVNLNISEAEIYRLLSEFFNMDSIGEARQFYKEAKISYQIKSLRLYCEKNGMTTKDFRRYAKEHHLEERLKNEDKLLNLTPEKLKAIIDKK
ncbi:MAG: hypothetical protein UIH27_16280 [Ruminococcus sp.]|nr:hypothetical protein [Ruminococcus sp.]